ncbi:MAG: stage III sporulation protein AF [Coprococcus sp.]|nr:stage III sporulation protein AF [Coprococcus sp.]
MFEYIYQWLQNLAFYMILVTVVIQVLPNNSYQKYIRFFCGLILVILLASPIMKVLGMEENLSKLYHSAKYEQAQKEMEEAGEYFSELARETAKEEGGE